jgi:hypothetical protein
VLLGGSNDGSASAHLAIPAAVAVLAGLAPAWQRRVERRRIGR